MVRVDSSGVARGSWAAGELLRLPRAARGLDVLHSVANFRARVGRAGPPRVLTVHDVLWRRLPEAGPDRDAAGNERARHRRRPARAAGHHRLARLRRRHRSRVEDPAGRRRGRPNGVTPPPPDPPPPADVGQGDGRSRSASPPTSRTRTSPRSIDGLALVPADARPLLAFAGHGTDAGALGARAAERGVEVTRLLGGVDPARLEALYAAASVVGHADALRGLRPAGARGDGAWRARRCVLRSCRCCARWPVTRPSTSTPARTRDRSPTRYERRSDSKGSAFGLPGYARRRVLVGRRGESNRRGLRARANPRLTKVAWFAPYTEVNQATLRPRRVARGGRFDPSPYLAAVLRGPNLPASASR